MVHLPRLLDGLDATSATFVQDCLEHCVVLRRGQPLPVLGQLTTLRDKGDAI